MHFLLRFLVSRDYILSKTFCTTTKATRKVGHQSREGGKCTKPTPRVICASSPQTLLEIDNGSNAAQNLLFGYLRLQRRYITYFVLNLSRIDKLIRRCLIFPRRRLLCFFNRVNRRKRNIS